MATTREEWLGFLAEIELARNYQRANVDGLGRYTPNPIVDQILPALLYVKMGAVLDHFMEYYIISNFINVKYKRDLHGRIGLLSARGCLLDPGRLHRFREDRNRLAHEPRQYCGWDELDDATGAVHAELQHLGLAGPRPEFEFFSGRTPSPIPEPGALFTFDYRYGLTDRGRLIVEVKWKSSVLPD